MIANFSVDYPQAQVYIPSTNEVFYVLLHDPDNPLVDAFLKHCGYAVGQQYNKRAAKTLRDRIVKYGIAREITLRGG